MKKKLLLLLVAVAVFFAIDFCGSQFLKRGLDSYFGLDKHAEVLLIGHSHLMLATDKEMMEDSLNVDVAKYCREGVGVNTRNRMIRHYLSLPEADSLKVVLYGVDQYMFNPRGLSSNVHTLFYPFIENLEMNSYIRSEAEPKDYWLHKIVGLTRYDDALINSSLRGWMKNWSNRKSGIIDTTKVKNGGFDHQRRPIEMDSALMAEFESAIKLLNDKGIHVIMVNTPIIKPFNDYQTEKRDSIIRYFQNLDESSPLIHYWDLNPEYAERYELFFDPIHVNSSGQSVITRELIRRYKQTFGK